jgi:hypothetical protein
MVFLLTPQNLTHSDWEFSSYREAVQVIAASETEARMIATRRFVKFKGQQFRADTSWGPWRNPELVTAREIENLDQRLLILSSHP